MPDLKIICCFGSGHKEGFVWAERRIRKCLACPFPRYRDTKFGCMRPPRPPGRKRRKDNAPVRWASYLRKRGKRVETHTPYQLVRVDSDRARAGHFDRACPSESALGRRNLPSAHRHAVPERRQAADRPPGLFLHHRGRVRPGRRQERGPRRRQDHCLLPADHRRGRHRGAAGGQPVPRGAGHGPDRRPPFPPGREKRRMCSPPC